MVMYAPNNHAYDTYLNKTMVHFWVVAMGSHSVTYFLYVSVGIYKNLWDFLALRTNIELTQNKQIFTVQFVSMPNYDQY